MMQPCFRIFWEQTLSLSISPQEVTTLSSPSSSPHLFSMPPDYDSYLGAFYARAARIIHDAEFVVQSIPNVEMFSVNRFIDLVNFVGRVLREVEDNVVSAVLKESMHNSVRVLLERLEAYRAEPPAAYNYGVVRTKPVGRGQPRLDLDLTDVPALLSVKTKMTDIAEAMGVSPRTIRNHMRRAGLGSKRRALTVISDVSLDEAVAGYVERHPHSGIRIIQSFLEGGHIFVPQKRVHESMARVNSLGLRLR